MKKKIWIINHYASEMFFNEGGRHYSLAENLKKMGYEPVIFCCNAKHDKLENFIDTQELFVVKEESKAKVPYVFVKSSIYRGNGISRFKNMFGFFKNVKKVMKRYAKVNGKPDVIIGSSVHPLSCVAGIQMAKRFKCECISEIRDLWPEEIVAYSNKWKDTDLLIKILYRGERWIYTKSKKVIFLQEGAYDYILEKKWDKKIPRNKVYYLNNGVDLKAFDLNKKTNTITDSDLDNKDYFNVVYAGSVRRVNNLGILLETAKLLKDTNIRFLVYGDGDEVEMLRERAKVEKVDNFVIKGKVAKKCVPYVVSRANANILHWQMSGDLKYGPSYNKMFEYFAAGVPVVTSLQTPYSIIGKYECGLASKDNTPESIADAVKELASYEESKLELLKKNARKAANEFDFALLAEKLRDIIEE